MKDNRGVTLIELLAVIAIMSIMAVFIYPNLQGTASSVKLKGFVRQVVADLHYSQQQAYSSGKIFRVYFYENYYDIKSVDNDSPYLEKLEEHRVVDKDIQITNINFTNPNNPGTTVNFIEYETDGTTGFPDGSFKISLQSNQAKYFENVTIKAFNGKVTVSP